MIPGYTRSRNLESLSNEKLEKRIRRADFWQYKACVPFLAAALWIAASGPLMQRDAEKELGYTLPRQEIVLEKKIKNFRGIRLFFAYSENQDYIKQGEDQARAELERLRSDPEFQRQKKTLQERRNEILKEDGRQTLGVLFSLMAGIGSIPYFLQRKYSAMQALQYRKGRR